MGLTRHHVIPVSRNGSNGGNNVVMVRENLHNKYHSLFGNKKPEEVLDMLVNVFWGKNRKFIENYMRWGL